MTESGYWDGSGWIDPAALSGDWDKDGGSSGGTLNGIGGIIGGSGNNGGGHNSGGSYDGGNGASGDDFTYNGGHPEVVVTPDNNTGGYNVNDAIDYLNDHAHSSSQGECAKYVRLALEAGGLSTNGHPVPACDYDDFLPTIGFHEISKSNYVPQKK